MELLIRKSAFEKLYSFIYLLTLSSIATKYDLPSVPLKLMNTTNMTRKQVEKMKKKQEKLDRVLLTLGVDDKKFLQTFRDDPMEVCNR